MSDLDKLFEKQFGKSSSSLIPKHDLTDKKEPKGKKLKGESYIPIRIYDENTEKYQIYFIRYDLKKNRKILSDFRKKMIEIEFTDLVKMEEFGDYVNEFTKDKIDGITKIFDMYDDIFTHVELKVGRLSGKLLKEIDKREKDEDEDEEGDTMTEWLQKKLIDKTFIKQL